ncbi:MAG: hypothetical protein IKR78_04340 [Dehalococcoidales bacterium]|jgi:hypothetical protein|nr:hypothetical protein [Dehalococcoidales bacterium]
MGSRDKGGKEAKKPKKGAQKPTSFSEFSEPAPEVEVIKKKRKSAED